MHFHSPQRLPFYPHRPHTRRHVYPGLLWLLRCSELRHPIQFDPAITPLAQPSSTGRRNHSYTIKQSKTDQTKKGHFIYIFKLQSPLSPYQTLLAFLHLGNHSPNSHPPPFHRWLQPPATRLWFPKAPSKQSCTYQVPQPETFPAILPNRRSNHSGPQRPFPTADPRTRSLVVRGFQKLHSTKPLPHQGSPPDPNRPSPLDYTSETP